MDATEAQGDQYWILNADQLRQLILDCSPDIRRDTNRMADLIREMVDTERAKVGLDRPTGSLTLWPNKHKTRPTDPELLGEGRIAGRNYRLAAWFKGEHNLQVSVLPAERK